MDAFLINDEWCTSRIGVGSASAGDIINELDVHVGGITHMISAIFFLCGHTSVFKSIKLSSQFFRIFNTKKKTQIKK